MAKAQCKQCGRHFLEEDDYWEDDHLRHCFGNKDRVASDYEEEVGG